MPEEIGSQQPTSETIAQHIKELNIMSGEIACSDQSSAPDHVEKLARIRGSLTQLLASRGDEHLIEADDRHAVTGGKAISLPFLDMAAPAPSTVAGGSKRS